jgi:hypothetical protein
MRISRLTVTIFLIATVSNPIYACAGSADGNGNQGTTIKPVSKPDPDCDHNDGLLSGRLFRQTL